MEIVKISVTKKKKIKKSDFYKNKKIFDINDIDVNKILASKKNVVNKHFIGYNDNNCIKSLYLELSQMIGCINKFDKNTIIMSLQLKDKKLFKNYKKIWKRIEKLMNIDFNTKPTYGDDDDKYIKTKIKTYEDNTTTYIYNKKGYKKYQKKKYHLNVYQ